MSSLPVSKVWDPLSLKESDLDSAKNSYTMKVSNSIRGDLQKSAAMREMPDWFRDLPDRKGVDEDDDDYKGGKKRKSRKQRKSMKQRKSRKQRKTRK